MQNRKNNCREYKDGKTSSYFYDCAQSEHNARSSIKHAGSSRHRDKQTMEHFPCRGALRIVIADNTNIAAISFRHEQAHVTYPCIDTPKDVMEIIANGEMKSPAQVLNCQFALSCTLLTSIKGLERDSAVISRPYI